MTELIGLGLVPNERIVALPDLFFKRQSHLVTDLAVEGVQ